MLSRLHIVCVNGGTETGRAIIRQRNAIDHKLSLILRAAGMQNCISFVEPAWLRIHQILQGSAGNRAEPVLNIVGADPIDGASLIGIDQSVGRTHRYRLINRGQLEVERVFDRDRGMNIDGLGEVRKARLSYLDLIDPVRETLYIQAALIIGRQGISILICLAYDLNRRSYAQASRVGHS